MMAPTKSLYNKTKESLVAKDVMLATTFFKRLKGLLGTSSLEEDAGLFLSPCQSIHMIGMKYSIDAVFLSKTLVVVDLVEKLQPGAMSKNYKEAKSCLELPSGTIEARGIEIGDQFGWIDS